MAGITVTEIRGENVRVAWIPSLFVAGQQHEVQIDVYNVTAANTFVLWVNGVNTAAISVNALIATTASNAVTALNAVTGVTWSVITSLGSTIVLRHSSTNFYNIQLYTAPITGLVRVSVLKGGYQTFWLETLLTNIDITENVEFVDVTPIMQVDEDTNLTKRVVTFNMSAYGLANSAALDHALYSGALGTMYIYEDKGRKGTRYSAFKCLIENVTRNYGDVVEITISGRRKGAYIAPIGSIVP